MKQAGICFLKFCQDFWENGPHQCHHFILISVTHYTWTYTQCPQQKRHVTVIVILVFRQLKGFQIGFCVFLQTQKKVSLLDC